MDKQLTMELWSRTSGQSDAHVRGRRNWIREVRAAAGFGGRGWVPPVEIVGGAAPPHVEGKDRHYTNRSGDRIRYPSAYSKKGWSSLVYRHSTRRIVVGAAWSPGGAS